MVTQWHMYHCIIVILGPLQQYQDDPVITVAGVRSCYLSIWITRPVCVSRRWGERDRRLTKYPDSVSGNWASWKPTGGEDAAQVRSVTLEEMFSKEWTHDLVNIRESYTSLTDIFHNLISRGGTENPETFHKLQEGFLETLYYNLFST